MNRTIEEKLRILSDAAKYDVSCSSSGSSRKNTNNGLGNAAMSGICHSWSADGRCISLLKILMTNYCMYKPQFPEEDFWLCTKVDIIDGVNVISKNENQIQSEWIKYE